VQLKQSTKILEHMIFTTPIVNNIRDSLTAQLIFSILGAVILCSLLPEREGIDGWSLFPPLVAISVAVVTKRLVLGLSLAILSGAILAQPDDISSSMIVPKVIYTALVDFLWKPVSDSFQIYILGFTASLIGMVRVISLAGGTRGIANLLIKRAAGARSTRLATALLGLAIFFDDYANTLVVGTTMRPITDKFKISREKLAYLIDSTAAPVAGVAIISTWIGFEIGLFEDVLHSLGTGISGYELFFRALPSRFYCILTLFFVLFSTLLRRDFGPMLRAEQRAFHHGHSIAPNQKPMTGETNQLEEHPDLKGHWASAALPVTLVVFGVIFGMYWDARSAEEVINITGSLKFINHAYWIAVFSNADGAKVMFLSALTGTVISILIALNQRSSKTNKRLFNVRKVLKTWTSGITGFYFALLILILAWAIKETCQAVSTADYLKIAIESASLSADWLPLMVFALAAIIAFSIGTSWTTMAILLPIGIDVAWNLGETPAQSIQLCALVAAAVLDGAIFGDHCSPISDTTVLSSIAASCDHIAHVRTQAPYALLTMFSAAVFGYTGSIFYSSYVGLLLGLIFLISTLMWLGQDPEKAL
jgi:Na+/H+ antiporter NhaC